MAVSTILGSTFPAEREAPGLSWPTVLMVAAVTCSVIGGVWDISWHMTIGRDTFWTPAHIAIYLGGATSGFAAGWMALRLTFLAGPAERAGGIPLLAFRAPLGAWIVIWGAFAMLTAGPFDNWWHNAYGLDVKIVSPPHVVLFMGGVAVKLGVWLLVLREQNRAARPGAAAWLFCYLGALMILDLGVVQMTELWPHRQHSEDFFTRSALAFPFPLVLISRASKLRWGATLAAGCYMLLLGAMVWILPLFAAVPRLGPIYNPVTHMRAPPFPLWLVVPAVAVDLLRHRVGFGRGWRRDFLLAGLMAAAFVFFFLPVQWIFSAFYITPGSGNWFFAGDRIWSYTFNRPEDLHRFWSDQDGWAARSVLRALAAAWASALAGSWFGSGMAKVQR